MAESAGSQDGLHPGPPPPYDRNEPAQTAP